MSLNDTLANALSKLFHDEKIGKTETTIMPASSVIKKVLDVLKDNEYIKGYEEVDSGKGLMIKVALSGNINKCGVIKPRFNVKKDGFERFEKQYLIARDMGIIIVSTPAGILTHQEAKKKQSGGKLIAYCY